MGQAFSITALVGDPLLHKHLKDRDNPLITNSLQQWSDVLKQLNLKKFDFDLLKWLAYDPQFIPTQYNHR